MPAMLTNFLVPQFALFNELEVKREHREIAAAGTPRRVIGGDFLFRQALALEIGGRRRDGISLCGTGARTSVIVSLIKVYGFVN
jgi:hypothetical protein